MLFTAPISVSATGRTTVVTLPVGVPTLTVWKLILNSDAATTLRFENLNQSQSPITGAFDLQAYGSLNLVQSVVPWEPPTPAMPQFTAAGGLVLNQSGTANIGGLVVYSKGNTPPPML